MPTMDVPPQDRDEEEPGEAPDYSELLTPSEEDGNLDDSASADLDAGVHVAELEGAWAQDDEAGGLDIGEPIGEDVPQEAVPDEGFGPAAEDLGLFVTEGVSVPGEEGEGVEESLGDLVSTDLPPLDASAHAEEEPAEEGYELGAVFQDEPPPAADRPWVSVPIPSAETPRSFIARFGARILAAGEDVVEVGSDGKTRALVAPAGSAVTGIVSCPGSGAILVATRAGLLFRADLAASNPAPVVAWRDAGAVPETDAALYVGGPTPSTRPALLLHVHGAGALLETTDQGVTFRRVELGGKVRVLGAGTPPYCVVETQGARSLMRSLPSGGFSALKTAPSLDGDPLAVTADGEVVALTDAAQGLLVSSDSGATFRRVGYGATVTAVAAGHLRGSPVVFAALLGQMDARAALVCIDARTAEARTIAEIASPDDEDDDAARVASLAWDESTETLWAAGAFGLRRFRSPPSA